MGGIWYSPWGRMAMDIVKNYPAYKNELAELIETEAYSSPVADVKVQTSTIGSGAEGKAINLLSDERYNHLKRAVEAVDYAIAMANTYQNGMERMEYINFRYWQHSHTHQGAAFKLNISERTAQRWNDHFVKLVAKKMGFI